MSAPLKIVQVLPELNSGGVERGTVEFSRYLVNRGHQSTVISNGGRLVEQLQLEGGEHISLPVHKKSLFSLRQVKPLRQLILQKQPDIIHVRSRMPAWLVWLALRRIPKNKRPKLVSTFHGLYSINRYSEIMACGDGIIAISQCVYDYIVKNYPRIDPKKISIVHRGVDASIFNTDYHEPTQWRKTFFLENPECVDKPLVVMPGRISSWKGHEDFIDVMAILKENKVDCVGLIVGDADPKKQPYLSSLKEKVSHLGLNDSVKFLGHRSDIHNIYCLASVVCNLSNRPEPFGRTVIEALSLGVPVVAYDNGGPAESLKECFPFGLVPYRNLEKVASTVSDCINKKNSEIIFADQFTLAVQAEKTLTLYQQALKS